MVAYLQIFRQKNAKFFQQPDFRSSEARNSMAIREYKQSSFFLQEKHCRLTMNCAVLPWARPNWSKPYEPTKHSGIWTPRTWVQPNCTTCSMSTMNWRLSYEISRDTVSKISTKQYASLVPINTKRVPIGTIYYQNAVKFCLAAFFVIPLHRNFKNKATGSHNF